MSEQRANQSVRYDLPRVPNLTWLYVGIVTIVAVLLARRSVDLPWRVTGLFYALVLTFFFRPLTGPYVSFPADVVRLVPPWSAMLAPGRPPVTKFEVSNMNLHDLTMQIVPWIHQARQSWRSFHVPLWNGADGCGYPLLANGQTGALSPLQWLTYPLPLPYAITADAAFRLLLAMVFTFLFCRRRLSELASVLAAVIFGFSTFVTTWIHFPVGTAAALLPAVLLAIDQLAEKFSRRRFAFAAIVFALAVLGGHPEAVYHVSLVGIAFASWIAFVERRGKRFLLHVVAAAAVAAAIASPFLATFAESVFRSQRFTEMRAASWTRPPYSDSFCAILLLQPQFFGHVPQQVAWWGANLESMSGFAGVFAIASAIGMAVHIAMRREWRRRETLFILIGLFALGVILGWPVILPMFRAIGGVYAAMRLRLYLCWCLAMLAGAMADVVRRDTRLPLWIGSLAVSGTLLYLLRTMPFPTAGQRDDALLAMLPSVAVLLAGTLVITRLRDLACAVIAFATLAELWSAISGWNPVLPMRSFYPRTPLIEALRALPRNEPFRILGLGPVLYPNLGAMFGLEDVRVHDPMANDRYVRFLHDRIGYDTTDYYAKWNDPDTPIIDSLNVKYLITAPDVDLTDRQRYVPIYAGRDGRIYENRRVLPRFFAVNDATVRIVRAANDSYTIRVQARQPGVIASSIAAFPGWRIRSDGRSLHRVAVNGPFLGFVVPAGESEIEIAYLPATFYAAAAVAIVALVLLTVYAWRRELESAPATA
jgi:membrane protein YfhO